MHVAKKKQWERNRKELYLSPPCTASGNSSADVGIQHGPDIISTQATPKSNKFKKAQEAGRATRCAVVVVVVVVVVDKNNSFACFSACGRVGGQTDAIAATNKSTLIQAIFEEHNLQGGGPGILAIELNANPENITLMRGTLVGGCASIWGGTDGGTNMRRGRKDSKYQV